MNDNLTDITVILDKSGSMKSVRNDTIGGFNAFLKSQKEAPGEAVITLVQFSNSYNPIYAGIPVAEAPELTLATYVPGGGTALLDAIGRTMEEAGARIAAMDEELRPGKVIFVIQTDGEENTSRNFTLERIRQMITDRQNATHRWDFVFLGADQDAIQAGSSLGVAAANTMAYKGDGIGTQAMYCSVSSAMTNYRSMAAEAPRAAFFAPTQPTHMAPGTEASLTGSVAPQQGDWNRMAATSTAPAEES